MNPKVVAKGQDHVAQMIKKLARQARVPVIENKPVARALYAEVEVGRMIPESLFQVVAEAGDGKGALEELRARRPDAAVLVVTTRALKVHSGRFRVIGGRPLPDGLLSEDLQRGARSGSGSVPSGRRHRRLGWPLPAYRTRDYKKRSPCCRRWSHRNRMKSPR